MTNEDIVNMVEKYVLELLFSKLPDDMKFHTVTHTQEVVRTAIEIAGECNFTQQTNYQKIINSYPPVACPAL